MLTVFSVNVFQAPTQDLPSVHSSASPDPDMSGTNILIMPERHGTVNILRAQLFNLQETKQHLR